MRRLALVLVIAACGGDDGAPGDGWSYQAIDGAVCGNGSPWGVASHIQPDSSEVVVFLSGGGACWDAETCFQLAAAVHVAEDVSAATVVNEARALEGWLFSRDPGAPFAGASFVYAPYCTGDLHAGRRATEYATAEGARSVQHVGAQNLDGLLAAWDDLLPEPDRLWLGGASAGGFGATLNWWRYRERFPDAASVEVLDDSGPPIDVPAERFALWTAAWDLEQPPGCDDCDGGFSHLLPHYAAAMPASDRYALLSYQNDGVIALFWGETGDAIAARQTALRATLEADERFGGFFLAGADHVVLADPARTTSTGVGAADWVGQFVSDSSDWTTVGP